MTTPPAPDPQAKAARAKPHRRLPAQAAPAGAQAAPKTPAPKPRRGAPAAAPPPGPAALAYARIIAAIRRFEADLDPGHEVAMGFAGGDAGVLRIEGLGYQDPDLLTFWGRDDDGLRTQLIQHLSQLSVILRAVPVQQDPPRRIGFRLQAGWSGGEAGDPSV